MGAGRRQLSRISVHTTPNINEQTEDDHFILLWNRPADTFKVYQFIADLFVDVSFEEISAHINADYCRLVDSETVVIANPYIVDLIMMSFFIDALFTT